MTQNEKEIKDILAEQRIRNLSREEEVTVVKLLGEELGENYEWEELAKMNGTQLKKVKTKLVKEWIKKN